MLRFTLLFLCLCLTCLAFCQATLNNGTTTILIDFDNTVSGVNNGAFTGQGLQPSPAFGELDADAWKILGMSEGDHLLGETHLSGDFARGVISEDALSGGLYSFTTSPNNSTLGLQPVSDDLTPGSVTLRIVNNQSTMVDQLNISYNIVYRNDEDKSNSLNFSFSWNDVTYYSKSNLDFSTAGPLDPNALWTTEQKTTELYNINLFPGNDIFLRWEIDEVGGTGFNDEFALDDISISIAENCIPPSNQPTNLTLTSNTINSIEGNFSPANSSNYLVLQSTDNSLTALPVNGQTYALNSSLGNSTVIAYSNSTNFVASGLLSQTTYYYFIFSAQDACIGSPVYLTANPLTESGQTDTTYYNGMEGRTCKDLKTALHQLIKGHTVLTYGDLWNIYPTTDPHLNDIGDATILWDIYTDNPSGSETELQFGTNQCTSSGNGGQEGFCYNREHTFPKSWWGGLTEHPEYTDAFHVLPVDGFMNTRRLNFPYGIVKSGTETFISGNGSKVGLSDFPILGYTGSVFEPIDSYKGDLARIYFYTATRYEDVLGPWQYANGIGDIVLDGSTFQVFENWKVDLLLDWHRNDPVSQKEIDRNNEIFAHQGNRNPFVDHPEYIPLIWGNPNCIVESPSVPVHFGYFETGYDGWTSGGVDCNRYNGFNSYENDYSIELRDNSGIASSMTSPVFDFSAFTEVEFSFFYRPSSMEIGEKVLVQYNDGSGWVTVNELERGTDFENGEFYQSVTLLSDQSFVLPAVAQFRIQCDASNDFDQVYIDEVIVVGRTLSYLEPEISLWLEGNYTNGGLSSALLQKNLLPIAHPYSTAPWNYTGTAAMNWQLSDFPSNAVDWVLVSFRTDITSASTVGSTVGLLLSDGTVHFPSSRVSIDTQAAAYYILVEHRNHMAVMSATPVSTIGNSISYDFRSTNSYTDSVGSGQKELSPGVWGLFAGDSDQLSDLAGYDINGIDNAQWKRTNGQFNIYGSSDYNFDGDINANDKVIWLLNNGLFSGVKR